MRVLHVIPSIASDQGGLRTGTLATCKAMLAAGMRPEIVCFNGPEPDDPPDVPIHRVKAGARGWLLAHARDYDAIIAHVVWLTPARYAAKAAARADVPLYLASRGMLDPDALAHHRLRKLVAWHLGVRKLVRRSVLVFSSRADRDRSLSHPDLRDMPAVVVPNPVDLPPAATGDSRRVVCLNRLHPRKGVLEWVNALRRLRDEGLVFSAVHAGLEQDRNCAARARERAAGIVTFAGPLSNDRARELVAESGILVHPAVGYENFGNVILEGMAAGKPVVASRRALVTPELEEAGVVVGVEPTAEHIADALRKLLNDKAGASALGAKARDYARENYSFEAVGKRWAEALRRT